MASGIRNLSRGHRSNHHTHHQSRRQVHLSTRCSLILTSLSLSLCCHAYSRKHAATHHRERAQMCVNSRLLSVHGSEGRHNSRHLSSTLTDQGSTRTRRCLMLQQPHLLKPRTHRLFLPRLTIHLTGNRRRLLKRLAMLRICSTGCIEAASSADLSKLQLMLVRLHVMLPRN